MLTRPLKTIVLKGHGLFVYLEGVNEVGMLISNYEGAQLLSELIVVQGQINY